MTLLYLKLIKNKKVKSIEVEINTMRCRFLVETKRLIDLTLESLWNSIPMKIEAVLI